MIYGTYGGRIALAPELMEKAVDPETVESIAAADYYFRSLIEFETAVATPHTWLNDRVAAGIGKLTKGVLNTRYPRLYNVLSDEVHIPSAG